MHAKAGRGCLGRTMVVLAWLGAAVVVWTCVFAIALKLTPTKVPEPFWIAGAKPVPRDFLYVMYPTSPSVPLFDRPDGSANGVLDRAVTISRGELESGPWFSVNQTGGVAHVRRGDLTFDPPGARAEELVGAYAAAFRARNPGRTFFDARVSLRLEPDGSTTVTFFRRLDDDHDDQYIYRLERGVPRPLEMRLEFGPARALGDLPRIVQSALIGLYATTIFIALAYLVAVRRRIAAMRLIIDQSMKEKVP